MSRSSAAVVWEITRWPAGSLVGLPPIGADDVRRPQDAAVGDRRVGGGDLDRRHRLALTERQVAHRRARVLGEGQDDPAVLAGQVDSGLGPEAEAMDPVVEAGRAELHADQVGADVAGDLEDLRDAEASRRRETRRRGSGGRRPAAPRGR